MKKRVSQSPPGTESGVGEQVEMSSVGRRQANADEKFDLSKKTIRDVAAELARRSQPPADAEQKPDAAGPDTVAAAQEAAPNTADNPTPSPSNLIQMDPRASSAPRAAAASLWSGNRPFSDDPAGRAPLEALSRALDHKYFEQQDEIGLTPSSEMTTELEPAPMVVPPSASHPAIDSAELPLQESTPTLAPSEPAPAQRAASRPTVHRGIRYYPARHFNLFNLLWGIWLHRSLRPTRRPVSAPMQAADIRWSTLTAGVLIGLAVGAGAVVLLRPTAISTQPTANAPAVSAPAANAPATNPAETTATAPATKTPATKTPATETPATDMPAAEAPKMSPSLPTTLSSVSPAAPVAAAAPSTAEVPLAPMGMTVALHPRDMTATTFGIPVALQPGTSPTVEGGMAPSTPAGAAAPTTKPAKPVKTKKPVQKSSGSQHAPTSAPMTEQLSPAKR